MSIIDFDDERLGELLEGIEKVKNSIAKLDDQQKDHLLIELIKQYEEPIKSPGDFDDRRFIQSKSFFETLTSLPKENAPNPAVFLGNIIKEMKVFFQDFSCNDAELFSYDGVTPALIDYSRYYWRLEQNKVYFGRRPEDAFSSIYQLEYEYINLYEYQGYSLIQTVSPFSKPVDYEEYRLFSDEKRVNSLE